MIKAMEQHVEYKFVFEKLDVWHLAKELAIVLYRTTKKFPAEERYGLVSQINRAVISVVSKTSPKALPEQGKRIGPIIIRSLIVP